MGLKEKKSSLKNLKYIPDVQGGGSSGLPYIKPTLPEDSPSGEYLTGIARTSADFPLRGGTYSTIASTEDTVRISRFLNDFPKGPLFTSKQVGLQKSNPKIETGHLGNRLNTQTYNLNSNLLAQVAEQGTGVHINRAGFNTNELENDKNKYSYIVSHKSTNDNKLVNLYNSKISGDVLTNLNINTEKLGISNNPNALFDYVGGPGSTYGDGNTYISRVVNTNSQIPLHEKGQINYRDTLGASMIARTKNIPGLFTKKPPVFNSPENQFSTELNLNRLDTSLISKTDPFSLGNYNLTTPPLTPQKINLEGLNVPSDFEVGFMGGTGKPKNLPQQSDPRFIRPESGLRYVYQSNEYSNTVGYNRLMLFKKKSTEDAPPTLVDFRSETADGFLLASSVNYTTGSYNNKGLNIGNRIGVGNPGARPKSLKDDFYYPFLDGQDKVNMSPIYNNSDDTPVERDSDDIRDLIKFVIEVIDNDDPSRTDRMHFRAYITNIADSISPDWNGQRYMGRGENFHTYQGINREISYQFKIAAQSVQEMEKLYQKLNYLASTLYPDYSGKGFMRGNLHKLTIGEYLYRMPGIIKSMNITIEDDYAWEIKMKQPELKGTENPIPESSDDRFQMEVPQILNVSMTFTPIYKVLPQKGLKSPIITSTDIANNYIDRIDKKIILKKPPTTDNPDFVYNVNTENS